jgi:hypothetical protein
LEIIKCSIIEILGMNNNLFIGRRSMNLPLKIGDVAPDFSLPATTRETLSLSDYRGNKSVVIAFYGMDFTPG